MLPMASAQTAASLATGRAGGPAAAAGAGPLARFGRGGGMRDGPGNGVELRVRNSCSHRLRSGGIRARDQEVVAGGDDAFGDAGDLVRRLARAENHFRESLTGAPVVVDPGESQVFEGGLA